MTTPGHVQLSEAQIAAVARVRELENELNAFVDATHGDARCKAKAKTDFETGFMFLVKGVTKGPAPAPTPAPAPASAPAIAHGA